MIELNNKLCGGGSGMCAGRKVEDNGNKVKMDLNGDTLGIFLKHKQRLVA